MDNLTALENWVSPLLERLTPAERRKLSRQVALDLRRAQRNRIRANRNPDGSAFEPRKPRARSKSGGIKRQVRNAAHMFQKMVGPRHFKLRATPNGLSLHFLGQVGFIARVHQYGLRAKVAPDGPRYRYPQRALLGFEREDVRRIRDSVLDHLSR